MDSGIIIQTKAKLFLQKAATCWRNFHFLLLHLLLQFIVNAFTTEYSSQTYQYIIMSVPPFHPFLNLITLGTQWQMTSQSWDATHCFCIHKWLPQQCFCLWRNSSEQHCETSPWHFTHSPSAFPLPLMFSHQALTSSTQCVDIWNVTARLHLQCESRSKPKVQQL